MCSDDKLLHAEIDRDEARHALHDTRHDVERLLAVLRAVVECDEKHEFHGYDYMHGDEEIRAVMKQARDALALL